MCLYKHSKFIQMREKERRMCVYYGRKMACFLLLTIIVASIIMGCNFSMEKNTDTEYNESQSVKATEQEDGKREKNTALDVTETTKQMEQDTENSFDKKIIVIDAGHQKEGNSEQEPIGPGAEETKAKVSSGTSGCISGMDEYELTLTLSLKLQEKLEEGGYDVVMTRTTDDVDISNAERAEIANEVNADAFIRIHANGSDDSSIKGAMTICQTPENPYNATLYEKSKSLSENILDELVRETKCEKQYVWETDSMSGINWCQVPVSIVEVGYMSNPEEDELLSTEEYQNKIVKGVAKGVEKYFEKLD